MQPFYLLITSCQRPDLLQQTLESLFECLDVPPQGVVIVEDSSDPIPSFLSADIWRSRNVRWLANGERRGQIYSADRLWAECPTEYALWCEDDWLFCETNFIRPSFEILENYPEVLTVCLRGDSGWHPLVRDPRFRFQIAQPNWRDGWGGFCFNPGLRRKKDFERIGSYGMQVSYGQHGLAPELTLSRLYAELGYVLAVLPQVHCTHIGGGRSKAVEPLPPLPRLLIAIPACHSLQYTRWESELSPHYSAATNFRGEPYGRDIHMSVPNNPRIQTLRETWWKDIPRHPSVTGRMFYGYPHPREALPDEVYVNVPDDYEHLVHKVQRIADYAHREGFEYFYKGDDDTAVYVERLLSEMILTAPFDYAGYAHGGVAAGGPGYFLSRRAMRLLADSGAPDHWAEDVWTAKVMQRNNIPLVNLPHHHTGFSDHYFFPHGFDPLKLDPGIVTMHALAPTEMRAWYEDKESRRAR